jgi:hypothetical protein
VLRGAVWYVQLGLGMARQVRLGAVVSVGVSCGLVWQVRCGGVSHDMVGQC